MPVELTREYRVEAARRLPALSDPHPCARLHGHSFRVVLTLSGEVDPALGWLLDYADIDAAFQPLHEQLDHRCLNDVAGLENPTSERLAAWIYANLQTRLSQLTLVSVYESDRSGCHYRP